MINDNGPKDGDFASYVEALNQKNLTGLHTQETHFNDTAVPAYAATSVTAPTTRSKKTSAKTQADIDRALAELKQKMSGSMSDVLGPVRWGLRIIGALLIAAGFFGERLSVPQIFVGIFMLSMSFRLGKKKP
jgi:hypothetical protein